MESILLFRTDRVGDFLLSLSLIKIININYPNSKITVIASKKNYDYIKSFNEVHEVIILNKCYQRIDSHANGSVLHDDGASFAAHIRTSTKTHTFIFFVRRDMINRLGSVNFTNQVGKLFTWDCGDKFNLVVD